MAFVFALHIRGLLWGGCPPLNLAEINKSEQRNITHRGEHGIVTPFNLLDNTAQRQLPLLRRKNKHMYINGFKGFCLSEHVSLFLFSISADQ